MLTSARGARGRDHAHALTAVLCSCAVLQLIVPQDALAVPSQRLRLLQGQPTLGEWMAQMAQMDANGTDRIAASPAPTAAPAKCGTIANPSAFCAKHGGNGLVPAPQSVACAEAPCDAAVDGHTCCRPPSVCTLKIGLGAVSPDAIATQHGLRKGGHAVHMSDMAALYLRANAKNLFNTARKHFVRSGGSPLTSASGIFDDSGICRAAFEAFDRKQSVCGVQYGGVTFACNGKSSALSLLEACVTPCMENLNNRCCMVPAPIAYLFPCCRELHCCPDQKASGHRRAARRALGHRAPSAASGRSMPAVSVAVGVEENGSAKNTYDGIVSCLKSLTAASCKSMPKKLMLNIKVSGAGRR